MHSKDRDVQDLDKSDKPERLEEEERGTKVSTLMCPWPLMITPFRQDMYGPQLTKRRLDDVDPNMELNLALIDKFNKVGF